MKVGFEVKIQKESEEYLDIPKLYGYKQVKELKSSYWIVIHMYPKSDTISENGDLNGFRDALFFDAHIYDATRMEYIIVGNKDGIDFDGEISPSRIYTYKDGSTCIVFKGKKKIRVGIFQSLSVWSDEDE